MNKRRFKVKKAIGKDIIPLLQVILDNRLYVEGYTAARQFKSIIDKEAMSWYSTPIDNLAIAVLYTKGKPIAWMFHRCHVIWSFTKIKYRRKGLNRYLSKVFANPLNRTIPATYASPHPKYVEGDITS